MRPQTSLLDTRLKPQGERAEDTDKPVIVIKTPFRMSFVGGGSDMPAFYREEMGAVLHENWCLKRQMAGGVSDASIDDWYATGLANGATGGKLLGAGSGGFLMLFAPPELHVRISRTLPELKPMKFRFDRTGAQIVFYQPADSP